MASGQLLFSYLRYDIHCQDSSADEQLFNGLSSDKDVDA